jgi:hypothetical protein
LRKALDVRLAPTLVLVAGLFAGCSRRPVNATPEGAARELTERLVLLDGAEDDAKAVYDLLSEAAQSNLKARAERYSNASGRQRSPWSMIVPSRAKLRFAPQSFEAKVVGKYALVDVLGVGSDQVVRIPCVLEKDLWRVDLSFPELPPLPRRPGVAGP